MAKYGIADFTMFERVRGEGCIVIQAAHSLGTVKDLVLMELIGRTKNFCWVMILLLVVLATSCREVVEVEEDVQFPLLWELIKGEEWHYDVTASYLDNASPKVWSGDETVMKRDGRIFVSFKRTKIYLGKKEIKKGRGGWDVMEHLRGGQLEEYEYFMITPKCVSFQGSKMEGVAPKTAVCLSTPMDLVRRGSTGGEIWQYALGGDEKGEFKRTFRVMGQVMVTVPAGDFEATRVIVEGKSRDFEVKESYWFHEKMGFVKTVKSFYREGRLFKDEVSVLRMKVPPNT